MGGSRQREPSEESSYCPVGQGQGQDIPGQRDQGAGSSRDTRVLRCRHRAFGEHQQHRPHIPAAWSCLGRQCALINTPTRNNCCSFVALETSSYQQSRGPAAPCLRVLLSPKRAPALGKAISRGRFGAFVPQKVRQGQEAPLLWPLNAQWGELQGPEP